MRTRRLPGKAKRLPIPLAMNGNGKEGGAAPGYITLGELQLAMHVVDLLALAPDDADPLVAAARALKAQLCVDRQKQVLDCFPVQQAYRAGANVISGKVSFHTGIR